MTYLYFIGGGLKINRRESFLSDCIGRGERRLNDCSRARGYGSDRGLRINRGERFLSDLRWAGY